MAGPLVHLAQPLLELLDQRTETGPPGGFAMWASGSLARDPDPSCGWGPSLTVRQTLGASAADGRHALPGRQTVAGLPAPTTPWTARRLDLRAGYGFGAFGGRFTATPDVGLALEPEQREYRLGWRA